MLCSHWSLSLSENKPTEKINPFCINSAVLATHGYSVIGGTVIHNESHRAWADGQGLALLTLSWDKNWDSHSLVNGYPSFYPRIALVAPSPVGYCRSVTNLTPVVTPSWQLDIVPWCCYHFWDVFTPVTVSKCKFSIIILWDWLRE